MCVCGFGFCLHSAFFWLGCWGVWPLACAASVSCHLLVGLAVAWGCAGVAVGWICPPPSPFGFFLFFFRTAGGVCGFWPCRVVALWCPPLPVPVLGLLVSVPPSPFVWAAHMFFFLLLPATSPVGCVLACPGCPFLRWDAALGWVSPSSAGRSSGVLSRGPVGVSFGVAWLGGFARPFWSGCAALRLCVCLLPPPFFFVCAVCLFPFFFLLGGVCLFLPLPSLGWCTNWSAFGVANRVAVSACAWLGRAPAPCIGWVMYSLGLLAFPVGLGSGSAGWAVAPGGFVRAWVKGGGVFGLPPPLWCRLGLSGGGLYGRAVSIVAGRGVAPSRCAAGWCGVAPRLWARFLPFWGVPRLARVRPLVSVPCFGAVVCFGAPCCVTPCFAVLRRARLCCDAVRSALSCRAVPCRAVVCRAVAWLAAPCCAAPRRVVLWCFVPWGALSWCVAPRCAAVRCAVLLRLVPCIAVPWCVVGPLHCRSGVRWGRCWLDWPVSSYKTRTQVMWLAGGWGARLGVVWLVGSVLRGSRCAFRVGGSGGCPRGSPPWGTVPWSRVLWGSLPLVLGVAPVSCSSSRACAAACVVALAAAGVVAWR